MFLMTQPEVDGCLGDRPGGLKTHFRILCVESLEALTLDAELGQLRGLAHPVTGSWPCVRCCYLHNTSTSMLSLMKYAFGGGNGSLAVAILILSLL